MSRIKYLAILFLFIGSCAVKKEVPTRIELKPLKISSKPKVFRTNPDKEIDILHTEINVSFDWEKHLCLGKEIIRFEPYSLPIDSFRIDAKQFIFHKIRLYSNDETDLKFDTTYDNNQLVIYPALTLQTKGEYFLELFYTAQPDKATAEGSSAIRDAKGLYFINTNKIEPHKPTQIWTQGETESNSNWFATVDKPYEKMTFDINITVPDSMTTLSNGLLAFSDKNKDNTRTDHWKVKKTMSGYLVMMAIGKFKKTLDKEWKGKEVSYYLEADYHPYAKGIFNHTREMIDFFSTKMGVPYAWQKYSQVVVRDFVSGAMENTSATLHGEFVQKNNRELIDNQNDGIVAHELFHHWFGDLVTCESWSHLTLNEGFATFGEQLWFGHKYGKTAELKRIQRSMSSYLRYSKINDEPIVRFYYKDKEEMFNAITYQKGARVLNLLKFTLGEEYFYKGVKNYLNKYSHSTAQIENLRHELENTSGKDLTYFFKQWYLRGGHPIINVSKKIEDNNMILTIEQKQEGALFSFPFQVRINNELRTIRCSSKKTNVTIPITISQNVYLDPDGIFIGEIINQTYAKTDILAYFKGTKNYMEKINLIKNVKDKEKRILEEDALLLYAINDKDPDISLEAMKYIDWDIEKNLDLAKEDLKRIATLEKNPAQKSRAIYILSAMDDKLLEKDFKKWSQDSSYKIAAASLYALNVISPSEAYILAKQYEPTAEAELLTQIATIYAAKSDSTNTFFKEQIMKHFGSQRNELIKAYGTWAERMNATEQNTFWKTITERATKDQKEWTRLASIYALDALSKSSSTITETQKASLKNIIDNEKSDRVRRQLIINKIIISKENN